MDEREMFLDDFHLLVGDIISDDDYLINDENKLKLSINYIVEKFRDNIDRDELDELVHNLHRKLNAFQDALYRTITSKDFCLLSNSLLSYFTLFFHNT